MQTCELLRTIACSVILLGLASSTILDAQEKRSVLVFTHIAIVDCTGAPTKPDMTILIAGNRITAVAAE